VWQQLVYAFVQKNTYLPTAYIETW